MHETVYRGSAFDLINNIDNKELKGEVTVVVDSSPEQIIEEEKIFEASTVLLKEGNSKKSIAKALSHVSQYSVNEIYSMIQHY